MRLLGLLLTSSLLGTAAPAAATDLTIGTSGSFSKGRYGGSEATKIRATTTSASATIRGWELSASLPYLQVDSGLKSEELSVGGVLITPERSGKIRGFGDISLSAGRPLPLGGSFPLQVRMQGQLKLPTGRSSLSSGKFDGGLDVQVSRPFGPVEPYLSVGRRFYGDPHDLELKDAWTGSAGFTLSRRRFTILASFEWGQSPIGLANAKDLFLVGSVPFGPHWNATLFGSKGLSSGSADRMLGLGITRRFKAPRLFGWPGRAVGSSPARPRT